MIEAILVAAMLLVPQPHLDPDPLPRASQRPHLLGYYEEPVSEPESVEVAPVAVEEPEPELEPSGAGGSLYEMFLRLADCESGDINVPGSANWSENAGTIYDGGIQFHPDTWIAYGGGEYAAEAWQASPDQQIEIGMRVLEAAGWGQWPHCSSLLGYS